VIFFHTDFEDPDNPDSLAIGAYADKHGYFEGVKKAWQVFQNEPTADRLNLLRITVYRLAFRHADDNKQQAVTFTGTERITGSSSIALFRGAMAEGWINSLMKQAKKNGERRLSPEESKFVLKDCGSTTMPSRKNPLSEKTPSQSFFQRKL
jgi:hypothetical protein